MSLTPDMVTELEAAYADLVSVLTGELPAAGNSSAQASAKASEKAAADASADVSEEEWHISHFMELARALKTFFMQR